MNVAHVTHLIAGSQRGSGYLIAPDLVLTAWHVVATSPDKVGVQVGIPPNELRTTGQVAWSEPERDIALVRIEGIPDTPFTRFGRLEGHASVPVAALGYPDATIDEKRVDTLSVCGDCDPLDGARLGVHKIRVSSLVPVQRTLWAGLSGAGVFSGGMVIGVVRSVPANFVAPVIEASALERVFDQPGFVEILRNAGLEARTVGIDAGLARRFGPSGPQAVLQHYVDELRASFRLDATGLSVSSDHALALSAAYSGMRYDIGDTRVVADLAGLVPGRTRLVIVGRPGSGKSVTLKRILASESVQRDDRIPLYLHLAQLKRIAEESDGLNATAIVEACASAAAQIGVPEIDAPMLGWLFAHGQIVLGLDGFDEIGTRVQRERVVRAIGILSDAAPHATLVVASRPDEYQETPLTNPTSKGVAPWEKATVRPLEGWQAKQFLRKCFKDDGRVWGAINRDDGLRELADSPLMLTLVALLHAERNALPSSKREVLEEIVSTSLERWESVKAPASTQPGAKPSARKTRSALATLALTMFRGNGNDGPFTEITALNALDMEEEDARDLLEWLVRRSGLLLRYQEYGALTFRRVIQFAHRQLHEYMAGVALGQLLANGQRSFPAANDFTPEVLAFAAGELARLEKFTVLDGWVANALAPRKGRKSENNDGNPQTAASLLASADPVWHPAPQLARRIVDSLKEDPDWDSGDELSSVIPLMPREAAYTEVLAVALLQWQLTPHDHFGYMPWQKGQVARCAYAVLRLGTPADRAAVIDFALGHQYDEWKSEVIGEWSWIAEPINAARGEAVALRYLRRLTELPNSDSVQIATLLDAMESMGYAAQAREIALNRVTGVPDDPATAGFAQWLEAADDDEALAAVDRYYRALAATLRASGGEANWSRQWYSLPIWPTRISDAAHAVRLASLSHPHIAFFVIRHALDDPAYRPATRVPLLAIAGWDKDRSRRTGSVGLMLAQSDTKFSNPLLLDAFAIAVAHEDVWVRNQLEHELVARGLGDAVADRIRHAGGQPLLSDDIRTQLEAMIAEDYGGEDLAPIPPLYSPGGTKKTTRRKKQ